MLSTNKLRGIYSKIQTQLFYMIPEKWDKICLYTSVIESVNHLETGEMFFYYYPTGILKKNPVNVYEIPNKFNIDEENRQLAQDELNDLSEIEHEIDIHYIYLQDLNNVDLSLKQISNISFMLKDREIEGEN